MEFDIREQYNEDQKKYTDYILRLSEKYPTLLPSLVDGTIKIRIQKHMNDILIPENISNVVQIFEVNPIKALETSLELNQDNKYPTIADTIMKFIQAMKPKLTAESNYSEYKYTKAYAELDNIIMKFLDIIENHLHIVKDNNTSTLDYLIYKFKKKFFSDRYLRVFIVILLISCIVLTIITMIDENDGTYKTHIENLYSTCIVSVLWILYHITF